MSKISLVLANPNEVDFKGFHTRLQGSEIVDCIAIIQPKAEMTFAFYSRDKSNQSITDSFVRTGQGVLDIDASRISASDDQYLLGNMSLTLGKDSIVYGKGLKSVFNRSKPNSSGRFPSNLILQHDVSCVLEGTKDMGNSTDSKWSCVNSCPVNTLDDLSGIRPSTLSHIRFVGSVPNPNTEVRKKTFGKGIGGHGTLYGDTGGASRFYKQVQGSVIPYLNRLFRLS